MRFRYLIPGFPALLAIVPLTLIFAGPAYAQSGGGHPLPPFNLYTTNQGLSQVDVYGMATDADGYLWLATMRGLNRFDGKQFVRWTANDGLRINNQTSVAVAADRSIWVGDVEGGLSRLSPDGAITTFDPPPGMMAKAEELVIIDDVVYVALDEHGVWRLDPVNGDYTQVFSTPSHISQLIRHYRTLFVRDDRDIYRYDTETDSLSEKMEGRYEGMAHTPDGQLWVGDEIGELWRWSAGTFEPVSREVFTRDIDSLEVDEKNRVWIRSDNTLITPSGARLQFYGSDMKDILVDRDNVVWVTSDSGLLRYLGDRFEHYPLRYDQAPFMVRSIGADNLGRIWFGGVDSIRIAERNGNMIVVPRSSELPSRNVTEILFAGQDQMLVGISGEGVYRLPVDLSKAAELVPGSRDLHFNAMRLDEDELLWLATKDRGVRLVDIKFGKIRDFDFAENSHTNAIELLPTGGVLAAVNNDGIYEVTRKGKRRLELSDKISRQRFLDIDVRDADNFLIGSEEGGLYEVVNGQLFDRSASAEIEDLNLYVVHRLANNTILAGTENGLFHIDVAAGRWFHYTQLQGLMSLEMNSDALQVDAEGALWMGTIDGATRVAADLEIPPVKHAIPKLQPPRQSISGEIIQAGSATTPSDGGVIFDFGAVSTARPEAIEYSYRLEGLDDDWSLPTTTPSVRYGSLPAGEFVFNLRARFHGDQWSPTVTQSIVSLPYVWQRPWFIALSIMLALCTTGALYQYRVNRIGAANKLLRERVEERTSHLKEVNDSLEHEIEERKKSEAAVISMEEQIRSAFENAPIGMAMIDADRNVFEFNAAFGELLSLTSTDGIVALSEFIWDHDAERFDRFLQSIFDNEPEIESGEFDCRRADDEKLHAVFAASVVHDADGNFRHALLQVQDVTEARVLTDRLEHQANFDELTGLHNRRAFENALQATLRSTKKMCGYLVFMDLDQFKVVNDTCGHGAGDELLRRVADVVSEQVRSGDVIGRLGGDEFGLILPGSSKAAAADVAERIRQAIEDLVFCWNGSTFRIGISIGAVPIQSDGDTAELQQVADAACYSAKEAGRNQVHIVEGENDVAQMHRGEMRWVQRLNEAIEHNNFVLYGQQIVPIQHEENQPERIEVLVRMRDPATKRLVPPGAFLPAAERYNMGVRLDEWVIKHLLDALVIHMAVQAEPRRYWVNLSGTSVGDHAFADRILKLMENAPIPPGMVNFEITETAVIRNVEQAGRFMQALRDLGCEFALDDFGNGLSSFGYLKKLPVDYVKIDGLFVKNIVDDATDRMFVKAIIDVTHSLGIKTIAEFVENEEILEVVRELGADYAQGFHVHRAELLSPGLQGKPISTASWSPRTADLAS